MWNDLFLNLFSEAVGIIVTVFLIERFQRSREEQRWKPSKDLIYIKLFKAIDDFMDEVLGSNFLRDESGRNRIYKYGDVDIFAHKGDDLTAQIQIINRITELKSSASKESLVSIYKHAHNQFEIIRSTSITLFEPELSKLLLELDYIFLLTLNTVSDYTGDVEGMFEMLSLPLSKAKAVRYYIESKADSNLFADEYIRELQQKLEEWEDKLIEE